MPAKAIRAHLEALLTWLNIDSPQHSAPLRHTVHTADKLALLPDFHRMGVAEKMQLQIGVQHLRTNPGAFMWPMGAGSDHCGKVMVESDHCGKVMVEGDAKRVAAQKAFQAAAEMTLCWKQYRPWIG